MSFRIVQFLNRSTTQIQVEFSADLDPEIGISNIAIKSTIVNIPDLSIKSIDIIRSILTINTSEQFPLALYYFEALSTSSQIFQSIDGDHIQENQLTNRIYFVGLERENIIRDQLFDQVSPILDMEKPTFVRNYISILADKLAALKTDILETANANYISVDVVDEVHTRGYGPTDRLANEGVYKVVRVGRTATGQTNRRSITFNTARGTQLLGSNFEMTNTNIRAFSSDPISLKQISVIEEEVSNAEVLINSFTDTIVSVSKDNLSQIHSLVLNKQDGYQYIYNIPKYGYAIYNNRYDTLNGRALLTLDTNQFKLSDAAILDGSFAVPTGTDELIVSYSYIDNGINTDPNSVVISQIKRSIREPVGTYLTTFFLNNFPITTSSGADATFGAITFLDPSPIIGTPFITTHKAFSKEILFSETRFPAAVGEYSVNYTTGQVFVFGETSADGTGTHPPVATYYHRKVFINDIDYNIDPDTDEVSANPLRALIAEQVKLEFNYEQVMAEGVDYLIETHVEVIDEEVENRFASQNQLYTKKYPITNVFKIFNTTTGETYQPIRFDNSSVYITGRQLPKIENISSEPVEFSRIFNETLQESDEVENNDISKIIKLELENNEIMSQYGTGIGYVGNTSLIFSDTDVFTNEFYYDGILQTLAENISKLSMDGYYCVDYNNASIYLKTNVDTEIYGQVSYTYSNIRTQRPNILAASHINFKTSPDRDTITSLEVASFSSDSIIPSNMIDVGERFLRGDTDSPIIVGAVQYGVAGQRTRGSYIFVALDATFASGHADGNHIIRFPNDTDRTILEVFSMTTVRVDIAFTDNIKSASWMLIDFTLDDGYTAITSYNIQNIRSIYRVEDLQPGDQNTIINLFDPSIDSFEENRVVFNSNFTNSVSAGDALLIDYSFGGLYADYTHVADNIQISYEYGDNSLNHSISDTLNAGDNYFVSYSYGALREALLANFGSLTQVEELTTFPLNFNRELYRDAIAGALQSFTGGPTLASIANLVSSITKVEPDIRELTFNEWTLDRDNLFLQKAETVSTLTYEDAHFGKGLRVSDDTTVSFPAEAYISLKEGTFEAWAIADWRGIDNDASITFNIGQDGYQPDGYTTGLADGYILDLVDIYIGASGYNPTTMPFTINRTDVEPGIAVGRPSNYGENPGYFIWFDEDVNFWKFRWVGEVGDGYTFTGDITTSGEIYKISDGYSDNDNLINESSDYITSTKNYIKISAEIDGYESLIDGYLENDGYLLEDGIDFTSDNIHYLMDTGYSATSNRLSIFKDGSGFLNFKIIDDRNRVYNISYDVSGWAAGEHHHISTSWRFGSAEGIDEAHLFIDGQEVSNIFKYGGRPVVDNDIYRSIASEQLTLSAAKTIISGSDGVSNSSSTTFVSQSGDFINNGIIVGDLLYILDNTADGLAGPYTITARSQTQLILSTQLTLSLNDISYSINQTQFTTETNIDTETIAVYTITGDRDPVELYGVDAEDPDYTITVSGADKILTINNRVQAGDNVFIKTLGLTHGRVREIIFNYNSNNSVKTNLTPPAALNKIDIYKYIFKKTLIEDDGYATLGDGYFIVSGSTASSSFTNTCQPSNQMFGKKLKATLSGIDNIDFSGTNSITINGSTDEGPTSEAVIFTNYESRTTTNHFKTISSIAMTFNAIDSDEAFGSIEIIENISMTRSENGGDRAQVARYDNGEFVLLIFGSGGAAFNLESCYYLFDYRTTLNIKLNKKGRLFIGSNVEGANQWSGIIDEVVILNEMLADIRAGEIPSADQRTITGDYNSLVPAKATAQTMMLLHMDESLSNVDKYYKIYPEEFLTSARSVNADFGDCISFINKKPFIIDNGNTIINNDIGTVEFWVSPMIDTINDIRNTRYYLDVSAVSTDTATSITKTTVLLTRRAKRIDSVRLISDNGSGVNYFTNGNLALGGKTITLGTKLPGQTTKVKVQYISIDQAGDRLSIYKDGYGEINFEILANGTAYQISYPISWERNSWHRVQATWDLNNINGQDRMRLFVDGIESGTILYGSPGSIYGIGMVYGSSAVGALGASFLTTNIDFTDTFSNIYIGNSFNQRSPSMCRMDNLRFSNTVRHPALVAGASIDLNYTANLETALPVISDSFTTSIYDFSKDALETEFMSNLLFEATPLFLFDVNIVDSFKKLYNNDRAKTLIEDLIKRLKPAHVNTFVKFVE